MGELVGGGYTLLYVYYLVWYTDLGGRLVFRRLTSLLYMLLLQGIYSQNDTMKIHSVLMNDGLVQDCSNSSASAMALQHWDFEMFKIDTANKLFMISYT